MALQTTDCGTGIGAHVRRLEQIPPLAEDQALLQAVNDEDIELRKLAGLIEASPVIAARTVGIANSALYSVPGGVHSVADAILRVLGLETTRHLVVGLAASSAFGTDHCEGFDGRQFWSRALLTGHLATELARSVRTEEPPEPASAYLCGLLHELGLIALAHVSPAEMAQVFATAKCDRPLEEVESEELGITHREAGRLLAEQWDLPDRVRAVIEFHGMSEYRGPHWPYCELIGLCSRWACQLLATEEPPDLADETADSLGIDPDALQGVVGAAHQQVRSILDLADLFMS